MFHSLIVTGNRRTSVIAALSAATAFGVLAMPGLVSADDAGIIGPAPTTPEPTAPGDLTNPTFPEPTNPDDLTNPDPGADPDPEGGDDPAQPGDPAAPSGQLPETGVASTLLVVLGVALTLGGSAVVTLGRRREG